MGELWESSGRAVGEVWGALGEGFYENLIEEEEEEERRRGRKRKKKRKKKKKEKKKSV